MVVIFFPGLGQLSRRDQALEHFGGQQLIARNQAGGDGGGIASADSNLLVIDSTVVENSSPLGGGIAAYRGDVEIVRSTISRNMASPGNPSSFFRGDGGGI